MGLLIKKLLFYGPMIIFILLMGTFFSKTKANANENATEIIFIAFPVPGWYMVSLPVTVADNAVSTLFPMALGVFSWEIDHYTEVTAMETGKGYWLAVTSPSVAMIAGTPITQFGGHYNQGWHLIGSVFGTVDFSDPDDTPDGSVLLPLFSWLDTEQRYDATTTIQQAYGHWMAVFQECDLTVQTSGVQGNFKSIANTDVEALRKKFGSPPTPPFHLMNETWHNPVPMNPDLSYNYPNPFNSTTMIKYHLVQAGMTNITISNIIGRKIRTLLEDYQQPGSYEILWNSCDDSGQPVVSGVYFYKIISTHFSDIKKMILIR